jgi:hypothetical protein
MSLMEKRAPAKPGVMLVSMKVGDLGTRLATELVARNVKVAAFCHQRHLLSRVTGVVNLRRPWHLAAGPALERAIGEYRPAQLVPTDDDAARLLHELHASHPHLRALIESSVGCPASFRITDSRASFAEYCASELPDLMPAGAVCTSLAGLDACIDDPKAVVVKTEGSMSGKGVVMPSSRDELHAYWHDVTASISPPRTVLRSFVDRVKGISACAFNARPSAIMTQARIDGWLANCAAYCVGGEVKAFVVAKVLAHIGKTGPSTVIQLIDHQGVQKSVQAVAHGLKLTGFHGFDYVVDGHGRAWLIELNPRFTPTAHLVGSGGDLVAAMCDHLGFERSACRGATSSGSIVLFPREIYRDANSPWLVTAYVDAPETDPALVRAMLKRAHRKDLHGLLGRLGSFGAHAVSACRRMMVALERRP